MTNEFDPEIEPELIDHLEASLRAPDPAAIHDALQQRQRTRARMTAGAAGVVAVLALVGGIAAFTGDSVSETETASVEDVAEAAPDSGDAATPAVADDSAPRQVVPVPETVPPSLPPETPTTGNATVTITECANTSRLSAAGSRWLAAGLPAEWEDQDTVPVSYLARGDVLIATDEAGLLASFSRDIPGAESGADCVGFAAAQATVNIADCVNTSSVTLDGQTFFGIDLPVEWQDRGTVPATTPSATTRLHVTGDDGLQATFRLLGQDEVVPAVCVPFGEHTQVDNAAAPTISTTTTTPQTTTTVADATTTTAAPSAQPPMFAPSADVALSGQWELVGLWSGNTQLSLDEFSRVPTIGMVGRQLGGYDGCNSQGSGLFYAQANGSLQLQGGVTTAVGCDSRPALDLYGEIINSGDRWGRTSSGSLVLASGDRLAEFKLVEPLPVTELSLDAPLNTIWTGDGPASYDTVDTTNPEVTLTIWPGTDSPTAKNALLNLVGCSEHSFAVTHAAASEGSISFSEIDVVGALDCEPTRNQTLSLEAMTRADYFVMTPWGIQMWDGPQALAVFANEEE